jgi:hypothetical protein
MPLHDWQFWIVTALAVLGGWRMFRLIVPAKRAGDSSCHSCPSGAASGGPKKRVTLTIEQQTAKRKSQKDN